MVVPAANARGFISIGIGLPLYARSAYSVPPMYSAYPYRSPWYGHSYYSDAWVEERPVYRTTTHYYSEPVEPYHDDEGVPLNPRTQEID